MTTQEKLTPQKIVVPQPAAAVPSLTWISGKIQQILLQDKEHFYFVSVNDGTTTHQARFGDPYTGVSRAITADNPMYSLIQQAYFHNQVVYMGVRDFGYDPQAGIERIIIDRVYVYHP
jgi:hypothetical protein